ncbi:transcriptional regulator [Candidatus Enterococcus clewellii]|uniref:Uncharacterized protein n=1 Tax=Candidatus Enterococcus clewellii TaxID=1834193 RepID=A0A242KCZ6_9ENTE|nr:transcriptional regulator [Enterococcus sp. 9E7_DIV0242]OTP19044.1 hypothetical protein A5888_000858 [Enterococcus sp. 9E7_DIV0242]
MKIIEQTNRTIDFQEINPEKPDLLTLVGEVKGIDSLSDDKVKEINEKLVVSSFDEFMKKFSPTVYSFFNSANGRIIYTLTKPEGIPEDSITEIPINEENDFVKMIITMLDAKNANGLKNSDFNFENITTMISPKKVMDDIRQVRKEIHYLYDQYEGLEEEDPKKLDVGDKLNEKFEMASGNYNNVMAMLPLAIEDIKTRLLLGQPEDGGEPEQVTLGKLTMAENGELKIIEAPKEQTTELALTEGNNSQELSLFFKEDYEAVSEESNDYVMDLVVRTFCPLPMDAQAEINYGLEVNNFNNYLNFYKESKSEFVKVVKPLIEKIVGVKLFFDQYQSKNKEMQPTLLITNTRLEMLTKSSNIVRLEKYLNTVNSKNDFENTIWMGIAANIALASGSEVNLSRHRFKGNAKIEKSNDNTMESLAILLNLLKDYNVQLYFSFETGEETTFDDLATNGVSKYIEHCKPLMKKEYSAFAVPCYPNFTIIPKNKSGVLLDSKMVVAGENAAMLSKEKEDMMKLWLEGVYVGAAYIAAGTTAACQCPSYLNTHFDRVLKDMPGVRYDIEARDHSLHTLTTLTKEISGFTNNVKNEINRTNFGFCFASENASYKNREINNVTVYKARSLNEGANGFEETYKTLVSTYVERLLRFQSNDFKMDNIMHFFSNNPESTRSRWMEQKGFVNSVIQDGDDVDYLINEETNRCRVNLMFNGNVKNLEVEVNKTVNAAV